MCTRESTAVVLIAGPSNAANHGGARVLAPNDLYNFDFLDGECYQARGDPPPLKWSDLRYVFDIKKDCNGKEAIQA